MDTESEYWYVRDAGNEAGPFSRQELVGRCQRGELDWYHEVSQDRLIWVSATTLLSDLGDVDPLIRSKSKGRSRRPWKLVLGVFLALSGLGTLIWMFQEPTVAADPSQAEAILRVLSANDRAVKEILDTIEPKASAPACVQAIEEYLAQVKGIELSGCPDDFREAFQFHLEAWAQLRVALRAIPGNSTEGFLVGFINGYRFQELDGGTAQLKSTSEFAANSVKRSYAEVKRIAASHDAVLP